MRWAQLGLILGVAALTLHFTGQPAPPAPPPGDTYPLPPSTLGLGRFPPPPTATTVTARTVALQQVLAGQMSPNDSEVDLGGLVYNTLPS